MAGPAAPAGEGKENEDAARHRPAGGHVPSAVAELEAAITRGEGEGGGARGASTSSGAPQGLREALRANGEENAEEAGGWRQYKCRPDIVGRKGRVEFYDFTGTSARRARTRISDRGSSTP